MGLQPHDEKEAREVREKKHGHRLQAEGLPYRHGGVVWNRRFSHSPVYFYQGVFMNAMLIIAFGLVALGSVIRLALFLTDHKGRRGPESV
jgi:hypothetical protein